MPNFTHFSTHFTRDLKICTVNGTHLMIAVCQLYNNKKVIQAKWVESVDVWLFYEIVGKVDIFRAEDQGEKDASDLRD